MTDMGKYHLTVNVLYDKEWLLKVAIPLLEWVVIYFLIAVIILSIVDNIRILRKGQKDIKHWVETGKWGDENVKKR